MLNHRYLHFLSAYSNSNKTESALLNMTASVIQARNFLTLKTSIVNTREFSKKITDYELRLFNV